VADVVVSPQINIYFRVLEYIEKLLEKISLAGITKVTGVSKVASSCQTSSSSDRRPVAPGKLTVECDEAWSFVTKVTNSGFVSSLMPN